MCSIREGADGVECFAVRRQPISNRPSGSRLDIPNGSILTSLIDRIDWAVVSRGDMTLALVVAGRCGVTPFLARLDP